VRWSLRSRTVRAGVECETKFVREKASDFDDALRVLDTPNRKLAHSATTFLADTYFDVDDICRDANCSFRVRAEGARVGYNWKNDAGIYGPMLVRRELRMTTDGLELDLANPFHQRLPILSELVALLARKARNGAADDLFGRFGPRILTQTRRRRYYYYHPSERLSAPAATLSVFVDEVIARSATSRAKRKVEFAELELELGTESPPAFAFMEELASDLRRAGYHPEFESKFQRATRELASSR